MVAVTEGLELTCNDLVFQTNGRSGRFQMPPIADQAGSAAEQRRRRSITGPEEEDEDDA
jgi:hypothetical protein